jgi:Rrf2 family protein
MKISKDFEIAMNILSYLKKQKFAVTSDELAQVVGSTPDFVQQIMAKLRKNHLVTSLRGPGGGYHLNPNCVDTTAFDVVTIFTKVKQYDADHVEADTPAGRLLKAVQDAYVNTRI